MKGKKYVERPYKAVRAMVVNTDDTVPSGGMVIVGGVYYMWENTDDRKGFTGSGSWFTGVSGGPTALFFGLNNETEAQAYVDQYNSLTAVFKKWSEDPEYDVDQYQEFLNAIQKNARGCADV